MPTYSYRCRSCEHTFNEIHRIDDRKAPENKPCPECGQQRVYQTINAPHLLYSVDHSLKTTASFNDRLKEIKKGKGKDNTIQTRGVS